MSKLTRTELVIVQITLLFFVFLIGYSFGVQNDAPQILLQDKQSNTAVQYQIEQQNGSADAASGSAENVLGALININQASATELSSLPGIGTVLAQRIIDYRTTNGDFTAVEEITGVNGIGEKKFEAIRDMITVK